MVMVSPALALVWPSPALISSLVTPIFACLGLIVCVCVVGESKLLFRSDVEAAAAFDLGRNLTNGCE